MSAYSWDQDEDERLDYEANAPEKVRTKTGVEILEICRWVVAHHSCREVNGTLLDVQTANAIVTLHDNLNPENQTKYTSKNDLARMGLIAWKLVS